MCLIVLAMSGTALPAQGDRPTIAGLAGTWVLDQKASGGSEFSICTVLLVCSLCSASGVSGRDTSVHLSGAPGKFPNTHPKHLLLAASLMRAGADLSEIITEAYEKRTFRAQRLLGTALSTLQRSKDGRIVWGVLRHTDFIESDATDTDTDGIVNQVRAVDGTDIAILFRETRPDRVRVSLRSHGTVNVSEIAKALGGGGHANASGCSFHAGLAQAVSETLAEVVKWTGFSL